MEKKNLQILIETVTRCGGNCSGCALSSSERMSKSDFNFTDFSRNAKNVNSYITSLIDSGSEFESISVFLGQGDHFLIEEDLIPRFVEVCNEIIPNSLKSKTVILISASAIGKEKDIARKMDLFHKCSIANGLPFFIQVVFDPKKMFSTINFSETYIKNILCFKNTCGMTELTINLGNDVYENMTPNEFCQWVISHGIAHVEFNWVFNKQTKFMWNSSAKNMLNWLIELLILNSENHFFEINFVPYMARLFKFKGAPIDIVLEKLVSDLEENIYIDSNGNFIHSQAGLISNLIPVSERMMETKNESTINIGKKIITKFFKNSTCASCDYKNICMLSGATTWLDSSPHKNKCPYDLYKFMTFLEKYISNNGELAETIFDQNPVQDESLIVENNNIFTYFENKITKKIED